MCQSYKVPCTCQKNTAEIFFGKCILNETAIEEVYCPQCSQNLDLDRNDRLWDNGWVIELDMEVVKAHAAVMEISPEAITAKWIFDQGFVTWVGITPDDHQRREQERNEFQKLAKTDLLAYIQAMREWGLNREKRFIEEGWRKMRS